QSSVLKTFHGAALHFDAQNVADRSGDCLGGHIGVRARDILLKNHGSVVFDAAVPVAAGSDARTGADVIRASVQRGDHDLRKLVGGEGIDIPERSVGGRGALKRIGSHVDTAGSDGPIRADGSIGARGIVVGTVQVAGYGQKAADIRKG